MEVTKPIRVHVACSPLLHIYMYSPQGGYKDGAGDVVSTWMPILDKENDWVQISHDGDTCIRQSYENPNPLEWGVTDDEDSDIMLHIVCCTLSEADVDTAESTNPPGPCDYCTSTNPHSPGASWSFMFIASISQT